MIPPNVVSWVGSPTVSWELYPVLVVHAFAGTDVIAVDDGSDPLPINFP